MSDSMKTPDSLPVQLKAEIERLRRENALLRSENYTLRQRDGMIVVKWEGR